ncbi:ribonuclease P protein component 4 (RNP4) [Vairimorpha necatrix]|uniref:Ribonuclease P protein component 4 (RNP4) n=1 Tax=Vairimorpha necatrix TaxID=6039 RepID=A0AAX4JEY4_9MICR
MVKFKSASTISKLNHMFKMALLLHNTDLHCNIIKRILLISKKFLIKIPISIKRSICYKCHRVIINNRKTKIIKIKKEYWFISECQCGDIKKYKIKKEELNSECQCGNIKKYKINNKKEELNNKINKLKL